MVGAAAASNLHIYEMPEVLFSLSANRDANEGLEVRCQSFWVNVDVRHPQRWIKIVALHSQMVFSRSMEVKWPTIRTQRQCGVVNEAKTLSCCWWAVPLFFIFGTIKTKQKRATKKENEMHERKVSFKAMIVDLHNEVCHILWAMVVTHCPPVVILLQGWGENSN